ncbi:MAG TPA: hypothetical protein VHV55_18765 [Pirellulales bacterium]|nr:hypothetical protein [Pirellulales bacterium]
MNCHRGFFWKRRIKLARAARGALAFWFAVLSLGVPLPAPAVRSISDSTGTSADGSPQQAYPCQDHHCGCRDAEHCWRACCCMTREQKFAWAVEHGVTPPAAFFAQLPISHASIAKKSPPAAPRSCCAKHRSTCAVTASSKPGACTPSGKSASGTQVSLISALGCQGSTMNWIATTGPSVRPEAALGDLAAEPVSTPLAGEPSLEICSPSFAPPVPPPRHG